MLRRADLQCLPEPVHERRLLSDPDLSHASQPPGKLPPSPVPPQHGAHLLHVPLDQPPFERVRAQRDDRLTVRVGRLHTARPEVPDDGIAVQRKIDGNLEPRQPRDRPRIDTGPVQLAPQLGGKLLRGQR